MKSSSEQSLCQDSPLQAWNRWGEAWQRSREGKYLLHLLKGASADTTPVLDALEEEGRERGWRVLRARPGSSEECARSFAWIRQLLEELFPFVLSERPDLPLLYRHVLSPLLSPGWQDIYGESLKEQALSWLTPGAPSPLDLRITSSAEICLRIANGAALFLRDVARAILTQPATPLTILLDQADQLDRWSLTVLKRFIRLSAGLPLAVIMTAAPAMEAGEEPPGSSLWADSEGLQADLWQRFLRDLPVHTEELRPCARDHLEGRVLSQRAASRPERRDTREVECLRWCDAVELLRLAAARTVLTQDREERARTKLLAARAWIGEQRYREAMNCLEQAYQEAGHPTLQAECAIYAGVICANNLKDSQATLRWVRDGLAAITERQDEQAQRMRGWLHNVSALAFYRERRFEEAGKALTDALRTAQTLEREAGVFLSAAIASNLSLLYEARGQIEKALSNRRRFAHALQDADPLVGREFWYRQACLLWKLERYEEAEAGWEQAYTITRRYSDTYLSEWISRAAACAWSEIGQWSRARYWAERSLLHAQQIGYAEGEVRSGLALALLYQLEGQPKPARFAIQQAVYISGSLNGGALGDGLLAQLLADWQERVPAGDAALLRRLFPQPSTRLAYPFHVFDL